MSALDRKAHERRRTALHNALTAVLIDIEVDDPEAAHAVLADVRNLDRILTAIDNAESEEL